MKTSRRRFLQLGVAAGLSFGFAPRLLLRPARAQAARRRALVVIFQRGAVDGLNMVVPFTEARYHDLRPNIAVPEPGAGEGAALDLDGRFGLHPAMAVLQPAFAAGELAVVHACGSPDGSRSHFDAQDYMESGYPGIKSYADGWLNRHLQSSPSGSGAIFRALALGNELPLALYGPAEALAISGLNQLRIGRGRAEELVQAAVAQMYVEREDLLGSAVRGSLEAVDLAGGIDDGPPANGATYPAGALGAQLQDVARVIRSGLGLEVAFLSVGGWDTHSNQGGTAGQLPNLLATLARAMAAFRTDLGSLFEDVCVLTTSEFGRTLGENGSLGTDHGHGTAMLVHGGTVKGGRVYGSWPGLGEDDLFEGRDLAVTTDFRTLFAEVIERHLGNPNIAAVFPGFDYGESTRLGLY